MKFTEMKPMLPNNDGTTFNPFLQDFTRMGIPISDRHYIMLSNHVGYPLRCAYIVDCVTGERWAIEA